MRALYTVFLGIVEGLTEWLPVSSTGHLILANGIFKTEDVFASSDLFLYVIQLGAILAVLTVRRGKLFPFSRRRKTEERRAARSLWAKIAVACVPAGIVGVLLDDFFDRLSSWQVIASALFIYGVAFCVIERFVKVPVVTNVGDLTYGRALAIGAFQTLSVVPGTSRSGSTILGGMIAGCSREAAAEFSFYMAIPVMFGVSFLKIVKNASLLTGSNVPYLLLGAATAYAVSLCAIRFLTDFVKKHTFTAFGVYRIVLSVAVALYFIFR